MASNQRQIQNKGKGRLFVATEARQEYYVHYENIGTDFYKIGKHHEKLGRVDVAKSYYRQLMFFQEQVPNEEAKVVYEKAKQRLLKLG